MYVLKWQTVYALTRGLFGCLFPELQSNEGNKHQNNTRVSTWTVRHKSTYTTLFLTWHNECSNDEKMAIFPHRPHVSLAHFTVCCWCHKQLLMATQWPDNCDVSTWQVISNSIDIDFSHGNIHGQSWKKQQILYHYANSVYGVSTICH